MLASALGMTRARSVDGVAASIHLADDVGRLWVTKQLSVPSIYYLFSFWSRAGPIAM